MLFLAKKFEFYAIKSTPASKKVTAPPAFRVETKTHFSFSRKAKIRSLIAKFREISFRENIGFHNSFRVSFREKFLLLGWYLRTVSVFAKIFNQCFGSGHTFRWLLNPDTHSKSRKLMRNGKFAQKLSRKENFGENFRENVRNFS
jgi:hypothetical protein